MIEPIISVLHNNFIENGITAEISTRIKDPTSILKKIVRKRLNLEEITDIIACRIIVANKEQCYKVLEIIHNFHDYDIDKFKDFISKPKKNGYQSIHTVIFINSNKRKVEIQIRDQEMHDKAEFGRASHSNYKYIKEKGLQKINFNYPLINKAYETLNLEGWTEHDLIAYEQVIKDYLLITQEAL